MDHPIFFAREHEAERLASLVSVYRGAMLYGATGAGKSSLINAGLLPRAVELGYRPERVRVQPRAGEALVIERIPTADDDSEPLPSLLAGSQDAAARVVLATADFEQRLQAACDEHRPLLVFDQFEELCTLFETDEAADVRRGIVDLLVRLLRSPLPVKLLFVFREDYLGKVKELLAACPELVDQALPLAPLAPDTLPTIIRGPFERYPDHFERELQPALAGRLRAALSERFGADDLSLSEVQTVCLRLWQADDPDRLLAEKGVQGLLEDYLGEALDAFPPQTRFAAVALLGQMVTPGGTRNVISAGDLVERVREEDPALSRPLLEHALDRLDRESRLVRRERRRDLDLYEITSEFLVPWISDRRTEARRLRERRRDRRRLLVLGATVGALLLVVAAFAVLAVRAQRESDRASRAARSVELLALSSASSAQTGKRLDVSLLLALGAYAKDRRLQSLDALMKALVAARSSGSAAIMHGHSGAVMAVAVSPRGGRVASGGADGTVRLWSTRTHRQIGRTLRGHDDRVNDVAFSPDGRLLASASDDGTARLWDLSTHSQRGRPMGERGDGVIALAFSRDSRTLASATWAGAVRRWRVDRHQQVGPTLHVHSIDRAAFSRGGRLLVTGSEQGAVRLWSIVGHRRLAVLGRHARSVFGAAFSPDGRLAASASDDGTVRLWSVATRRPAGLALRGPGGAGFSSVAFSADGRTLAATSWDRAIELWNVGSHRLVRTLHTGTDSGAGVAFGPAGRTLAVVGWDETVRLWSLGERHGFSPPLVGHSGIVSDVAFSPDGRLLASAGYDDTIGLWSAAERRRLSVLRAGRGDVESVAFSPDRRPGPAGGLLASGADDHKVRLWSVARGRQVGRALTGHADAVSEVAFQPPDGRTLASASRDGTVRFWDVAKHQRLGPPLRVSRRDVGVSSLAFSSDGARLATGAGDGAIRLWKVDTRTPLGTLHGHTDAVLGVAFSPDGSRLASASADQTARMWSVATREQIGEPLRDHKDVVWDVAFSPDGRLLASAGGDAAVRLWSVDSGRSIGAPLADHADEVRAVAFSPDGTTLASASSDKTVRLWPGVLSRDLGDLRADVCRIVGASLSHAEWRRYVLSVPYRRTCPGVAR